MLQEGFEAEAHRVVGEFMVSMAQTEFAMDEFLWTTSNLYPDHLETADYNGHKFADKPPTSINDKIELTKHFHQNIEVLQSLEDKNGLIDINQWMADFKDIYDFRNKVAHGNVDAIIKKEDKIFLRAHKHPTRKPFKISSYLIDIEDIKHASSDLIYYRSGFREATDLITTSMKV